MEKRIIIKANGEIVKLYNALENEIKELNRHATNPCGSCRNCYANKCLKVEDTADKKDIRKYDYITDGFQINDNETGELDYLVVEKCAKYEHDLPRKKATTREEIENLKLLKESIKILFFDAGDLDEADNIQDRLFRRQK